MVLTVARQICSISGKLFNCLREDTLQYYKNRCSKHGTMAVHRSRDAQQRTGAPPGMEGGITVGCRCSPGGATDQQPHPGTWRAKIREQSRNTTPNRHVRYYHENKNAIFRWWSCLSRRKRVGKKPLFGERVFEGFLILKLIRKIFEFAWAHSRYGASL